MTARISGVLRDLTRVWPYAAVTLSFWVSRLIYRAFCGVRLDPSPVSCFVQYINPWFLKHDFLRSILYLHHQAPLQNVLVGIPLKFLKPASAFVVVDVVYVMLGLATALGILTAMLQLGARPAIAAVISSLYAISPATVLYENWLFYHLPVACFLVLSLVALLRFYQLRTFRSGSVFFILLTTTALFRSTLTLLFIAAIVALLLIWPPLFPPEGKSGRRVILTAASAPLLVLALICWKPSLLIGHGYGEAMFWGNIVTKIHDQLPDAERQKLQDEGLISPAAGLFCLTDLNNFGQLRIPHPPTGVPLLDMDHAPDGTWNAHALEYLLITRQYYKPDALYLLAHYPGAYLQGVQKGLSHYFEPTTSDSMLPGSRSARQLYALYTSIDRFSGIDDQGRLPPLMIGLPLLVAYGIYRVAKASAWSFSERRAAVAFSFTLITILYVTAVTTLVSSGDFCRYRFDLDPLYTILLAVFLSDLQRTTASAAKRILPWIRNQAKRLVPLLQ